MRNFISMLRALDLLDGLEHLIPDASGPGPLEVLEAERKKVRRKRAPRTSKASK
jgi:hypothetical protein